MKQAGEEEKQIAIKCGNVNSDGIPMCTVIADGQWSKRSYKTKYDALSGGKIDTNLSSCKLSFVEYFFRLLLLV